VSVNLGNGTNTLNLAAGANSLNTLFAVQSINGTSSADVLNLTGPGVTKVALGSGNDTLNLSPQSGGVTFVYADGGGADTVFGFNGSSGGKIDLSGVSGIASLADVQSHATMVGSDTVINFGTGNSITLKGVALASLASTDFVFGTKPILSGDNVTVDEGAGGVATVHGIHLTDNDPSAILSVSAVAGHGTVAPASISGATESAINAQFATGVVYTPTPSNDANQVNDIVTVSVTDNHGLTDALHFVFQQSGTGGIALTGTDGKDIIFSTGGNDTLTGLGGRDNFVFAPHSGSPAQYTITDFSVGLDKIDVRQFAGLSATTPPTEVQQGSDALITLDNNDTLLLKNVSVANLHNTDFIFHG
jgi:Ca2+-binding RTX toxin-like protein